MTALAGIEQARMRAPLYSGALSALHAVMKAVCMLPAAATEAGSCGEDGEDQACLVARQDVHKALLLGPAKHGWRIRVADVCVQHVRVELRHHVPARMHRATRNTPCERTGYMTPACSRGTSTLQVCRGVGQPTYTDEEATHSLLTPERMQLLMEMSMSCVVEPACTHAPKFPHMRFTVLWMRSSCMHQ